MTEPKTLAESAPRLVDRLRSRAATAPPEEPDDETLRRAKALAPPRFADAWWPVDQPDEILSGVGGWLDAVIAGGGENLILSGPVGTGKTWAAYAAARWLVMYERAVVVITATELLDRLRPDGDLSAYDVAGVDVLVLDELGGERATDWTAERLYLLVNLRWLNRRPTVVTTNLRVAPGSAGSSPPIAQAIGLRTWDRLRDGAVGFTLGGKSRRSGQ